MLNYLKNYYLINLNSLFKELIFIKKIIILQIIPHKILILALQIISMLTIIAAASENNALGKDNQLVWHLPDDFKRFKSLT